MQPKPTRIKPASRTLLELCWRARPAAAVIWDKRQLPAAQSLVKLGYCALETVGDHGFAAVITPSGEARYREEFRGARTIMPSR